jgi:hypothetical protein
LICCPKDVIRRNVRATFLIFCTMHSISNNID